MGRHTGHARRVGLAGVAAGLALVGLPALQADAATFTVSNTNDSGAGSLRQAVADASAAGGDDIVVIPAGLGTITLISPIEFTGTGLTTVQGNANTVSDPTAGSLLFDSDGSSSYVLDGLTMNGDMAANTRDGDLTIANSTVNVDDQVANTDNGDLTITNSTITSGNYGTNTSSGTVTVTDSTITAVDVAVDSASGAITITGSAVTGQVGVNTRTGTILIADSQVKGTGQGVDASTATISVVRSSIIGDGPNTESGVTLNEGPVIMINSTVTGFRDVGVGAEQVQLVYATVLNNGTADDEGGAANVEALDLTTFGSVLTSGVDDCDIDTVTSQGYNFSNDQSCGLTGTGDVQDGGDPGLGSLADNGGPGLTFLPQPSSPLMNAIPTGSCQAGGASGITTDERSLPRPSGAGCEVGAVEVQATVATTTTPVTSPTTTVGRSNQAAVVAAVPRFTG